jgi:hypothetical protein
MTLTPAPRVSGRLTGIGGTALGRNARMAVSMSMMRAMEP